MSAGLIEWLVHSSLAGSIVLLAGGVGMALTRQPARRQRVGELGLVASVLVAGLCLVPGWLPVSLPLWPAEPTDRAEMAGANSALGVPPLATTRLAKAEPRLEIPQAESPELWYFIPAEQSILNAVPGPRASTAVPNSSSRWPDWLPWIAATYLIVVVLQLGRCLLGYLGLRRLWQASHAAPPAAATLFAELTRHWRSPPSFRVTPRLSMPISFGLWHARVLVPPTFCRPGAERELEAVLVHELTHLQRRDAWSCLLLALAQAVYFYLPWLTWIRRQVRLCQEHVADAAAAALSSSAEYAEYLVSLSAAARPRRRADAVPVTGVMGNTSDLFRRIAMLLNGTRPIERRPPRWWSWAAASAFVALALFVSGLGLHAKADSAARTVKVPVPAPDPEKKDDPAKKPDADKPAPKPKGFDDAEDAFRRAIEFFPGNPGALPGFDPDQFNKMIDQMFDQQLQQFKNLQGLQPGQLEEIEKRIKEAREQMKKARLQGNRFGWQPVPNNAFFFNRGNEGRLGAMIEPVSDTLATQLDLPKGQGQVVKDVNADSAAAKAGIKPHDILLELAGKPVSNSESEFRKAVAEIKANTPVDAVVFRKGKKTDVKGISLPEAQPNANAFWAPAQPFPGNFPNLPNFQPGQFPNIRIWAPQGFPNFPAQGAGVSIAVQRQNDQFSAKRQEGGVTISLSGTIANDKASLKEITITEGGKDTKYESVEKVPETHRANVNALIQMIEKGKLEVEAKQP